MGARATRKTILIGMKNLWRPHLGLRSRRTWPIQSVWRLPYPRWARLLDNVEFDTQLINQWAYEFSTENREPSEIAMKWVAANKDRVSAWLGQ